MKKQFCTSENNKKKSKIIKVSAPWLTYTVTNTIFPPVTDNSLTSKGGWSQNIFNQINSMGHFLIQHNTIFI